MRTLRLLWVPCNGVLRGALPPEPQGGAGRMSLPPGHAPRLLAGMPTSRNRGAQALGTDLRCSPLGQRGVCVCRTATRASNFAGLVDVPGDLTPPFSEPSRDKRGPCSLASPLQWRDTVLWRLRTWG